MGILKLHAGMSFDDVKTTIEQKEFKNEKQKTRAEKRLVSAFASADKNNDNILSEKELRNYRMNTVAAVAGTITLGAVLGTAVCNIGTKFIGNKLVKTLTPVVDNKNWKEIIDNACKNVENNFNKLI